MPAPPLLLETPEGVSLTGLLLPFRALAAAAPTMLRGRYVEVDGLLMPGNSGLRLDWVPVPTGLLGLDSVLGVHLKEARAEATGPLVLRLLPPALLR